MNHYVARKWIPKWPETFLHAYEKDSTDYWTDYYFKSVSMYGHTWKKPNAKKKPTYAGNVTAGHGKKYAKGSNGKYFGTLGHDALEYFYTYNAFPFDTDIDAYVGATKYNLARLQYEDGVFIPTTYEEIETACRLVIHTLISINTYLNGAVVSTEQKLSSKTIKNEKGFNQYGKTDLLLYSPEMYKYGFSGGLVIVDYKFAKSENKKEWAEQVSVYLKLVREYYKGKVVYLQEHRIDPELELVAACIIWVRAHKKTKKTLIDIIFYNINGQEMARKELR